MEEAVGCRPNQDIAGRSRLAPKRTLDRRDSIIMREQVWFSSSTKLPCRVLLVMVRGGIKVGFASESAFSMVFWRLCKESRAGIDRRTEVGRIVRSGPDCQATRRCGADPPDGNGRARAPGRHHVACSGWVAARSLAGEVRCAGSRRLETAAPLPRRAGRPARGRPRCPAWPSVTVGRPRG